MVARGYGLPVRRILLYPLGGISEIDREAPTPGREFAIAAAGPALSLLLGALGWGLYQVESAGVGGTLIRQLMFANIIVGLFNLLPGLPLDGGRMLRAVIWLFTKKPNTATIAAAWVGRVLALGLLAIPFFTGGLSGGDMVSTLWVIVIAGFMWTGATQSIKATRFRERLPALQARRLGRRAILVPAATPLAEAVRRADEAGARAIVVVDHENKPIAIVNEAAVTATPPQRRPWIDVGSLARTIDPSLILNADLQGMALLDALRRATPPPSTSWSRTPGRSTACSPPATLTRSWPGSDGRYPSRVTQWKAAQRGPFEAGDQVQLTDPKGRMHQIVLQPGAAFHTHRGALGHDDLIGAPEGSVVTATSGTQYVALRPLLADYTLAMKRGADHRLPEGRGPDPRLRRHLPRRPGARGGRGLRRAVLLAAAGDGPGRRRGLLRGPGRLRRDRPRERAEILRGGPPVVAAGHRGPLSGGSTGKRRSNGRWSPPPPKTTRRQRAAGSTG